LFDNGEGIVELTIRGPAIKYKLIRDEEAAVWSKVQQRDAARLVASIQFCLIVRFTNSRVMSIDATIPAPFGIIPERTLMMMKVMQLTGKQQEKMSPFRWKVLAPDSAGCCCRLNGENIIKLFLLDYELESLNIFICTTGSAKRAFKAIHSARLPSSYIPKSKWSSIFANDLSKGMKCNRWNLIN